MYVHMYVSLISLPNPSTHLPTLSTLPPTHTYPNTPTLSKTYITEPQPDVVPATLVDFDYLISKHKLEDG